MALMVEDVERVAESYYTPGLIARWVRAWPELCTKAVSPSTSFGLMIPGPTPASPKIGARQRGANGDKLTFAAIQADLERAQDLLDPRPVELKYKSLEYRVVLYVQFAHTEAGIAAGLGVTEQDVRDVFRRACEAMAAILGWVHEPEDLHPYHAAVRACAECGEPFIRRGDALHCGDRCYMRAWRKSKAVVASST